MFGKSFITFDRLHYATKATGSYILAQDTLNYNLSVILHHQDIQRQINSKPVSTPVIAVWIAETNYTLLPNGVFYINGTRHLVPYQSCIVNVTLWSPSCDDTNYTRLTSRVGLEIYYKPEAIELSLNGFYYQKMRGLCGNNNNKITQEFQKRDDTIATTEEEFVNSWKIDESPIPEAVTTEYDMETIEACDEAFNSPTLEPVSHEIDLRQFYDACLMEVQNRGKEDMWKAVCHALYGVKVAAFSRDFDYPNSTTPLGIAKRNNCVHCV